MYKDPRDFSGNSSYSVTQAINLPAANFNALCTIGKEQRMSPSASMMEAMIRTKYGSNAGAFHFVFGLSSDKALLEGLKSRYRDVGIAHSRFAIPNKADNHQASNWEFSYHDFFHLDAFSAIPEKHRLAFYEIATQMERAGLSSKFEKAFYAAICDGEHPVYRKEANPNEVIDDSTFWFALFTIVYKAASHIGIQGNDAQIITQLTNETIFQTMGKEVGSHLQHFSQKFGLSAPSIVEALQRISVEFIQDFAQTYGLDGLKKVIASHPIIIFVEAIQKQTGKPLV